MTTRVVSRFEEYRQLGKIALNAGPLTVNRVVKTPIRHSAVTVTTCIGQVEGEANYSLRFPETPSYPHDPIRDKDGFVDFP